MMPSTGFIQTVSKYSRLPLPYFIGKFVKVGFPYYEDDIDYALYEEMWVKPVRNWGNWLVGKADGGKKRLDLVDEEIYFLRDDVLDVMGATH